MLTSAKILQYSPRHRVHVIAFIFSQDLCSMACIFSSSNDLLQYTICLDERMVHSNSTFTFSTLHIETCLI